MLGHTIPKFQKKLAKRKKDSRVPILNIGADTNSYPL